MARKLTAEEWAKGVLARLWRLPSSTNLITRELVDKLDDALPGSRDAIARAGYDEV